MKIAVVGAKSNKIVKNIITATSFYAETLMNDICDELDIDIDIDYEAEVAGHCMTEDELEYPRAFTIVLNPDRCERIYQDLAHEMVHVKQYARGELYNILALDSDKLSFSQIWMNRVWIPTSDEHPYFDAPWEVEAYGKEVGLYYRWKEFCNGTKRITEKDSV